MPPYPSDNLYSGDDDEAVSDSESFSNELSPSDGYFQRSEMPTGAVDPTIDYGRPEAKTLIDPPSSQHSGSRVHPSSPPNNSSPLITHHMSPSPSHGQAPSVQSSSVPSRHREPSFSEHDSMIYQPPPAYSESAPTSFHSARSNGPLYNTFPTPQVFSLQPREPQSMGGPMDEPLSEDTPLIALRKRCAPRRRRVKVLLFIGIMLAVAGSTIGIILGCPNESETPHELDDVEYCPQVVSMKDQIAYEFTNGKELSIVHRNDNETPGNEFYKSIQGEFRVRQAGLDAKHGGQPYITVDTSDSAGFDTTLLWSEMAQRLEFVTTKVANTPNRKPQCLSVIITAVFPDGTDITNLNLESPTLNLALSDLPINVTGHIQYITQTGSAWVADEWPVDFEDGSHKPRPISSKPHTNLNTSTTINNLHSRRTIIETHSGSITGSFPLYDEVRLSSDSGDINVSIWPKEALDTDPQPADLEVQTASGSIKVYLPLHDENSMIPSRNYITRVHTTSGSIGGHYFLGSESSFKTTSASIDITALPVLPDDMISTVNPPNLFETHTLSGSTKVSALNPWSFNHNSTELDVRRAAAAKLRSLRSSHSSSSGDIDVVYTDAWEGSVHAKSVSGELKVRGSGFRTIKERNGVAFREILKRRGVNGRGEGSDIQANTVSGGINFDILV